MGKKRRKSDKSSDASEPSVKQTHLTSTCVVHTPTVGEDEHFTSFSSVKCEPSEKLLYLLEIRDRRQAEPIEPPNRMTEICNLLPETLDGINSDIISP